MILEALKVGQFEVNCYILGCPQTRQALIIDPGADYPAISRQISRLGLTPKLIVNTHGHADHIAANADFRLPVWIHGRDGEFLKDPQKNLSSFLGLRIKSPAAAHLLEDGEIIHLGTLKLKVIHTPGHTPGGICLLAQSTLFSGDTLFKQGMGRTDFEYGSEADLIDAIKNKLFSLADDTRVYPGHGPCTTIGEEKRNSPFL